MEKQLTIGAVSRTTGLSVKAIRFYEEAGVVPPAQRTEAGYRFYSANDVRRLRLLGQMRHLGMPLAEIKPLLEKAVSADCATFASELGAVFERQRTEINLRIAELETLQGDLDALARHVEHCRCEPGQAVADCDYCPILDEEGGECCEDRDSGAIQRNDCVDSDRRLNRATERVPGL